jgi:predicted nuclease of restriction endonuclease-like (RecB) superfamily
MFGARALRENAMTKPPTPVEEKLFLRVSEIIDAARGQVTRSVNTAMVHAYWLIGREIVEVQQSGSQRAEYGERVVRRLAERLAVSFGPGFSYPSVKRMKQFYLAYPHGSAMPDEMAGFRKGSAALSQSGSPAPDAIGSSALSLSPDSASTLFPPFLGWTHYIVLMRVANAQARAFYEIEAARENWSTRELGRQIGSLLFERLARSRSKERVLALAREGQQVSEPSDVLKDPMVLEFLDLGERSAWRERDLEQAIIDRLEAFLLELGKGFCFVARQKRLSLDGDHFYVDLVFYNRLLRCFVLVDLKLGKLTHQDLGQMMMYVNWFDRFQRAEHEQPTVGIILCSEKNDAAVKITLPADNTQIIAARYQHYLPTEEELRAEVNRSREEVEHRLFLDSGGLADKGPTRSKSRRLDRRRSSSAKGKTRR